MSASKIPFKDLDATIAAVQKVAENNNIPSLAWPSQGQGRGGDIKSPQLSAVTPSPLSVRAPRKTCKVALPSKAIAHIRQRMVTDNVTQQYILMEALKLGGIPIDETDLIEDGRRDR